MGALGKAPDEQGNGLTPLEHRRILWTQYQTFGLISGGEVEGTSVMEYRVRPGAVAWETSRSSREAVIIPVPEVTVRTEPAPATGSRTDFVQIDERAMVHVLQSWDRSMYLLSRRTVPAGITATTATTARADRDYAVPLAGMLGVMDRWDEQLGHRVAIPRGRHTIKQGQFVVPGDRRMMFDIRHSVTSAGYTDPIRMPMSANPDGAILYTITLNDQVWKVPFYHSKIWQSHTDEIDFWVMAGTHTWTLQREVWIGEAPITLGGGTSDVPKSYVKVVDQGATR
ncbi:MAG: hypothetical protein Q4G40_09920 [Brachybacterium sp.]|nr:hypothetical protein [Brachybacterium sp.]